MARRGSLAPGLCVCVVLTMLRAVAAGVEFSNSVILVSFQDVEPMMIEGRWQRQCEYVVNQARKWRSRSISLVPTVHWAGGRAGVDHFMVKEADGSFSRMDERVLQRWQAGLTACFQAATAAGFTTLHVLTHLDDPTGIWRNGLVFDPRRKYAGFSYTDVVLMPSAKALAAAMRPGVTVEFALAGEMGRSMITFPRAYMELVEPVRKAISSGQTKPAKVLIGASLNWSRHCSCTGSRTELDPVAFNASYAQHFNDNRAKLFRDFNVPAFRELLWRMEFIGLSGYGVLPASNVQPADFQLPAFTLAYELSFWGISLRDLVKSKPLVYSEWGIGGSGRAWGSIASSTYEAGRFPVHGKWTEYEPDVDPWRRSDLRSYRQQVYSALTQWLRTDGGPFWKVAGLYVWSVGTWDALGIHPVTENARGTFGDPVIKAKVMELNGFVNGRR